MFTTNILQIYKLILKYHYINFFIWKLLINKKYKSLKLLCDNLYEYHSWYN